jgi:hypothetical protein
MKSRGYGFPVRSPFSFCDRFVIILSKWFLLYKNHTYILFSMCVVPFTDDLAVMDFEYPVEVLHHALAMATRWLAIEFAINSHYPVFRGGGDGGGLTLRFFG